MKKKVFGVFLGRSMIDALSANTRTKTMGAILISILVIMAVFHFYQGKHTKSKKTKYVLGGAKTRHATQTHMVSDFYAGGHHHTLGTLDGKQYSRGDYFEETIQTEPSI